MDVAPRRIVGPTLHEPEMVKRDYPAPGVPLTPPQFFEEGLRFAFVQPHT